MRERTVVAVWKETVVPVQKKKGDGRRLPFVHNHEDPTRPLRLIEPSLLPAAEDQEQTKY